MERITDECKRLGIKIWKLLHLLCESAEVDIENVTHGCKCFNEKVCKNECIFFANQQKFVLKKMTGACKGLGKKNAKVCRFVSLPRRKKLICYASRAKHVRLIMFTAR